MGDADGSYRARYEDEEKAAAAQGQDPMRQSHEDADNEEGADGPQGVPLVQGSGRIASSTLTVHGFETKFKEEIDIADTLLLHHPV